jgi:hypothetical protein
VICLTNRSSGALSFVLGAAYVFSAGATSFAADHKADPKPNSTIDLADGKILLTAPDGWARKTPRVRIIEHEFAVPASKGDKEDGRVTVMGAGGTVEANLDRWIAQFSQADGSETKNQVPEADRKKTIAGLDVYGIDLTGTFRDMPRPFDPSGGAVERQNYRMLAAVIASPKLGNYFIKFYGPRQTVNDRAEEFHKMIAGLQTK